MVVVIVRMRMEILLIISVTGDVTPEDLSVRHLRLLDQQILLLALLPLPVLLLLSVTE
jgi:hypothetical protein